MTSFSPAASPCLVAGASGTIGRAVVRRLVEDGHRVTAMVRAGRTGATLREHDGARLAQARLDDAGALDAIMEAARPEVVVSCLASRSGAPRDAEAVDFAGNCALLDAARRAGVRQFILVSAICVQHPQLAFQHAKLAFEAELAACGIGYTIVRPTAFFKSLSGQVGRVKAGKPFLIFGDGELTRCKPISDDDLARFIVSIIGNPEALGQILPIGGPGPAISLKEQGELLFALAEKKPRFRSVSPAMFTFAEKLLGLGAPFSAWFAEKAQYARIAHYYATQSMLVRDPATGEYRADLTPEFGSETLRDHYRRLLAEP
jgi:divinyl chlorophyllide a 8-vinyl-reductase